MIRKLLGFTASLLSVFPLLAAAWVRISVMGLDGGTAIHAEDPRAAYDPINNRYLVTWTSNTETGSSTTVDKEVWGVIVDYTGGTTLSDDPSGAKALRQ